MKNAQEDQAAAAGGVEELKDIKSLLVLLLLKGGATQGEIAKALKTHQSTVSRQFAFGSPKPLEAEVAVVGGHVQDQ
jgi:DNA-binding NarL/FixJ family response regulator